MPFPMAARGDLVISLGSSQGFFPPSSILGSFYLLPLAGSLGVKAMMHVLLLEKNKCWENLFYDVVKVKISCYQISPKMDYFFYITICHVVFYFYKTTIYIIYFISRKQQFINKPHTLDILCKLTEDRLILVLLQQL